MHLPEDQFRHTKALSTVQRREQGFDKLCDEPSRVSTIKIEGQVMSTSRERTRSIWMDVKVSPRAPMLDQDLTVDTVIVGSGIAGLSTAYELALEGQKVAVLDRGRSQVVSRPARLRI
jgi:hypothetical protein